MNRTALTIAAAFAVAPFAAQAAIWTGLALFGVVLDLCGAIQGQPMIPQQFIIEAFRASTFL